MIYSEESEVLPPCSKRGDGLPCEFEENWDTNEMECKYCGLVGTRILYRGQDKVYDHEDEKKLRADQSNSHGMEDTRIGDIFSSNPTSLTQGFTAPDRTLTFSVKKTKKNRRAQVWVHDLQEQCGRMQLKARTTKDCIDLFILYAGKARSLPERKKTTILVGVIFYGCKMNDDQRTIQELANQTRIPRSNILAGIKLIEKNCNEFLKKCKVEPLSIVTRYCQKMNPKIKNIFLAQAGVVAEYIHQYLEGIRPTTEAATYIVLTYRWFYNGKVECNEEAIANLIKIKLTTLKSSIAKVENDMKMRGKTESEIIADAESRFSTD